MTITLTPELEDLVNRQIERGDYQGVDDVLRAALFLLDSQQIDSDWLLGEIDRGLDDEQNGEIVEVDEGFYSRSLQRAIENSKRGKPVKDAVRP